MIAVELYNLLPDGAGDWLMANCKSGYEIKRCPVGIVDVVMFESEDDAVLFQFQYGIAHSSSPAEPAFDLDEVEATIELRNASSYLLGADDWSGGRGNEAFIEEVRDWCDANLTGKSIVIQPATYGKYPRAIIGIPDDDDRMLFLFRWEGHPLVEACTEIKWAEQVDEKCTDWNLYKKK